MKNMLRIMIIVLSIFLFFNLGFCKKYRCGVCSAEVKPEWEECPRCASTEFVEVEETEKSEQQKSSSSIIENKVALGINYPGLSFKYVFNKMVSAEIKILASEICKVFCLRISKYFWLSKTSNLFLYTGGETGYVYFKTKDETVEGDGVVGNIFCGIEKFLWKHFSVGIDIGPTMVYIKDKNYEQTEQSFDFVVNLGINIYF